MPSDSHYKLAEEYLKSHVWNPLADMREMFAAFAEFVEDKDFEQSQINRKAEEIDCGQSIRNKVDAISEWLEENGLGRKAFVVYNDGTYEVLWRGGFNSDDEYCKGQALKDANDIL